MLNALAQRILAAERVTVYGRSTSLVLQERAQSSKCIDTPVFHRDDHFALKLRDNDHLKFLRGNPGAEAGFCNLPDYLIFSESTAKNKPPIERVSKLDFNDRGSK